MTTGPTPSPPSPLWAWPFPPKPLWRDSWRPLCKSVDDPSGWIFVRVFVGSLPRERWASWKGISVGMAYGFIFIYKKKISPGVIPNSLRETMQAKKICSRLFPILGEVSWCFWNIRCYYVRITRGDGYVFHDVETLSETEISRNPSRTWITTFQSDRILPKTFSVIYIANTTLRTHRIAPFICHYHYSY